MAILEEETCCVCGAEFLKGSLDEEGRCKVCAAAGYLPGAAEEQDYIKSEKQRVDELKELIKQCLREIKEEERQEKIADQLKPRACKKCGNTFTPRAPANTICLSCQNAERGKKK